MVSLVINTSLQKPSGEIAWKNMIDKLKYAKNLESFKVLGAPAFSFWNEI